MNIRLPHWLRIPRPSWPRRKRAPESPAAPELASTLRVFRGAALWAIGILTAAADGAAFTESYRGLFLWAQHHNFAGFWAAAFPAQVDTFIMIGELALFVAMVGGWERRDRLAAWAVALLGLAVSIAGNVGHVAATDLQSRGTAAVPPVAAFGALWLGLGVLKRVLKYRRRAGAAADETVQLSAPGAALAETIGGLVEAARALTAQVAGTVPAAGDRADETALLGELLEAVREVGIRIGAASSMPVPVGAEHAALIAYRATKAAGNPYSMNALQARFGLTRSQAEKVRAAISDEFGAQAAELNGQQLATLGAQN